MRVFKKEFSMKELEKTPIFMVVFFRYDNILKIVIYPKLCYLLCHLPRAMLSFMPFTPSYAIFYAIYPAVVLFFLERYATVHNTNP